MEIKRVDFFILCLQGFCIAFNVASVSAVVPTMARDFGASVFVVGRVSWAYMLPYGLVALVYGPLTRYFDNKRIAVVSLSAFAFFTFLSGCAQNYPQLFIFRFMVGIFAAAVTPLSLIYIADHAAASTRGKFVGLFFSATFTADLLGLFLSGFLNWRQMFFIPAVLSVLTALLTLKYFPKTLSGRSKTTSRYFHALAEPAILRVFIYIFMISLVYHGVRQWLGVYLSEMMRLSQFFISLTLTLISLAAIFGEFWGGLWSDKKGRVVTLKSGVCLMTISLFLLIWARSVWMLPLLMLLWGFGWTLNHSGLSTLLTDLNKDFMKEIASLNSSIRFTAGGVGTLLAGEIMRRSFSIGFFIYAVILLAMFLGTEKILGMTKNTHRVCVNG